MTRKLSLVEAIDGLSIIESSEDSNTSFETIAKARLQQERKRISVLIYNDVNIKGYKSPSEILDGFSDKSKALYRAYQFLRSQHPDAIDKTTYASERIAPKFTEKDS